MLQTKIVRHPIPQEIGLRSCQSKMWRNERRNKTLGGVIAENCRRLPVSLVEYAIAMIDNVAAITFLDMQSKDFQL